MTWRKVSHSLTWIETKRIMERTVAVEIVPRPEYRDASDNREDAPPEPEKLGTKRSGPSELVGKSTVAASPDYASGEATIFERDNTLSPIEAPRVCNLDYESDRDSRASKASRAGSSTSLVRSTTVKKPSKMLGSRNHDRPLRSSSTFKKAIPAKYLDNSLQSLKTFKSSSIVQEPK